MLDGPKEASDDVLDIDEIPDVNKSDQVEVLDVSNTVDEIGMSFSEDELESSGEVIPFRFSNGGVRLETKDVIGKVGEQMVDLGRLFEPEGLEEDVVLDGIDDGEAEDKPVVVDTIGHSKDAFARNSVLSTFSSKIPKDKKSKTCISLHSKI